MHKFINVTFLVIFGTFYHIPLIKASNTTNSFEEKVGSFEHDYMSAAYARIEQLEEEGNLDVKRDIRIRDNFNRLNRQVRKIKKDEKKNIEELTWREQFIKETVEKFDECIKSTVKDKKGNIFIKQNELANCSSKFRRDFVGNFWAGKRYLTFSLTEASSPQEISSPQEKGGFFEHLVMPTTYTRIEQLENEGNLNVKKDVRIRDNFNRVNNQVISLQDRIRRTREVSTRKSNAVLGFYSCIDNLPIAPTTRLSTIQECSLNFEKRMKEADH